MSKPTLCEVRLLFLELFVLDLLDVVDDPDIKLYAHCKLQAMKRSFVENIHYSTFEGTKEIVQGELDAIARESFYSYADMCFEENEQW